MAVRVGPMSPVRRCVSRRLAVWCAALVVALVAAAPARAQVSTFDLSGTISDDQGGVLPGVTVTARNEETGTTRSAVTDAAGATLSRRCRRKAAGKSPRSSPASARSGDRRCVSRRTPSPSSTS